MTHALWLTVVASALLAPTTSTAKDLIVHQQTSISGRGADSSEEGTQYWSAHKVVVDNAKMRVITDLAAKTVTMADKEAKTYHTRTFEEVRQQVDAVQAAIEKQMEQMPPEARAFLKKMGNPLEANANIKLKLTGKSEKIAGFEAKEYTVEGGPMRGAVWASDALPLPLSPEDAEVFRNAMGGMGGKGLDLAKAMARVNGLPLRTTMTVDMGQQAMTTTTVVTDVREAVPPPEAMAVPAGFKLVAGPSFKADPASPQP